ncbi:MAG: MFS transporter [Spirulina sp.]
MTMPLAHLRKLFGIGTLFWLSLGLLFPTLPLYIQDLGETSQQVGWAASAVAVGLLLSRTWLGGMADRTSRRILLLFGLAVAAIAPLVYWLVPFFPVLLGFRLAQGMGIATLSTGYMTLAIDATPPQHRGQVLSYMGLTKALGVGFGALLGSFLQRHIGYPVLFLTSSSFALIGLLYCRTLREPPREKSVASRETASEGFWKLVGNRRIGILVLLALLMGLTASGVGDFLPLFIEDARIAFNPGLFYLTVALSTFSTRILLGGLSDRSGRGLWSSIGLSLYCAAMLVLWNAREGASLIFAAILEGVSFGMTLPTFAAIVGDRTHQNERGRTISFWMGGFDLGIAISAPIAGALVNIWGYRSLFALGSSISAFALLLFFTHSSCTFSKSWRYACGRVKDCYARDING